MRKLIVSVFIAFSSGLGFAQETSFLPENDLHLYKSNRESGITKEVFDQVISSVSQHWTRMARVPRSGYSLRVVGEWSNDKVNAYASASFQTFEDDRRGHYTRTVKIFGGLARHPAMTTDSLALVVCHEIAHLFGGAPYKHRDARVSAEGQADFWGTNMCLAGNMRGYPKPAKGPTTAGAWYCNKKFPEAHMASQKSICKRQIAAGEALGKLLADVAGVYTPQVTTPSQTVVARTITDDYPTVQCRLDTYVSAALGNGRPSCWFKN